MGKNPYWQGRRVLVTGHEGFLGSWLTRTLVEYGARVEGVDKVVHSENPILAPVRKKFKGHRGNIARLAFVRGLIGDVRPQDIFHVAAEAIVGRANQRPVLTFQSNIQGTWNVLEAARENPGVESIVAASSDKAYGSHEHLPYVETTPLNGQHPYDVSKSCADLLCVSYAKTFGVPVCVTRCGNIYGPGDFNFSRLVPDALRHIIRKRRFVIRSDGHFTRDYIFVADVVEAYLALARKMKPLKLIGEAFNISCERPVSVLNLFETIDRLSGKTALKPAVLNQAAGEIRHQYLRADKMKTLIGWKPRYDLERGLKDTLAWYKDYFINQGVQ